MRIFGWFQTIVALPTFIRLLNRVLSPADNDIERKRRMYNDYRDSFNPRLPSYNQLMVAKQNAVERVLAFLMHRIQRALDKSQTPPSIHQKAMTFKKSRNLRRDSR